MTLVTVSNLGVELDGSGVPVVEDVSFTIAVGEVVGLVGESGSGKTTIGNALLGYARKGCHLAAGAVHVDGVDVRSLQGADLAAYRGLTTAYIPQDPTAALNPARRIGAQVREMLTGHRPDLTPEQTDARVQEALTEVGLPDDPEFQSRFPHQLSGGQQQRIAIAIAFILRPRLVVMDEPTTGLDVTTQQVILRTVRQLCKEHGVAALYVTHDLAVVANLVDRVLVAYAGRLVESAPRRALFADPQHPYTQRLLLSVPDIAERRSIVPIAGQPPDLATRGQGCAFAARCDHRLADCLVGQIPDVTVAPDHDVRCLRAGSVAAPEPPKLPEHHGSRDSAPILTVRHLNARHGSTQVLFDVGLSLDAGECLALVGESGSGKTTLSRSLVGLTKTWDGEVRYHGERLDQAARSRDVEVRRRVQYVFQSPYNALNPRRTIGDSVGMGAQLFFGHRGKSLTQAVGQALEQVSLPRRFASRYPDQLSGGERQRAAIARALACRPEVLICDEITSALDVSVQAAIVKLLGDLRRDAGLTLLFVTHNLALVRTVADRVLVLQSGRVVEAGAVEAVLGGPTHDYTRHLVADTLSIDASGAPVC